MAVYRIYEGRRYSDVFWQAVSEWRRLARLEGIPFTITQGGHNGGAVSASASTHNGDAVDVRTRGLTQKQIARLVVLGRMVGIAVWFRTTNVARYGTRAQGFGVEHLHGVPNGWGHPSQAAANQAIAYRNGRDGLARNLEDLGPGHVSTYRTRTWAGYKAANTTPKGDTKMSEEMVRKVVKEEIANALATEYVASGKRQSLLLHILQDTVLGQARSAALGDLRTQLNAVASQLGVKIDQSKAAILSGINKELDESIHDAMVEHFPSMERAEADEIASTIFELLVTQLNKK